MKTDLLTRFLFDDLGIRGEFLLLKQTTDELLSKHQYPAPVANLLGEMACASLLLSATLKIRGSTSIQAKGQGPVTSIMAEATHQRTCRGIAIWESDPENQDLHQLLGQQSTLAITITPQKGERYQGIVALEQEQLDVCLEGYFMQSEQLHTRIKLFHHAGMWGGLLLQQLPLTVDTEEFEENWNRINALTETLTLDEFQGLDSTTLLHRLFHEENIRVLHDEPTSFWCSCSEERTLQMIKSLGQQEANAILQEQGAILVGCEFCHQQYKFDQARIDRLFNDPTLH